MSARTSSGLLVRLLRNTGWLAGSKFAGAALSIVYLALAARTLGAEGFGAFAMVVAYGQAVANLVQFQSWQLVIRFGAEHLANGRPDRMAALVRFGMWLDVASAALSALAGFAGVWLLADVLGWTAETAWAAQLFSLSLVGWLRATPTGILRLLDQFDRLSWAETLTPVIRFAGAIPAAMFAGTIEAFLAIWALSEIAASLLIWWMAARGLARRRISLRPGWPRGVTRDNPQLWRFAWTSNATGSVNLIWQQLGTLAVGGSMGEAAAGGFRLAFQIAQALAKPALLLGRVIYPELTRFDERTEIGRLLWRTSAVSALCGLILVALAALLGRPLLGLIGGPDFTAAAPLLTILTLAVAIDLAGFVLEPALMAAGRAGWALLARSAGAATYAALVFALIGRWGAYGVAYAAVAGSLVAAALSLALTRRSGLFRQP